MFGGHYGDHLGRVLPDLFFMENYRECNRDLFYRESFSGKTCQVRGLHTTKLLFCPSHSIVSNLKPLINITNMFSVSTTM